MPRDATVSKVWGTTVLSPVVGFVPDDGDDNSGVDGETRSTSGVVTDDDGSYVYPLASSSNSKKADDGSGQDAMVVSDSPPRASNVSKLRVQLVRRVMTPVFSLLSFSFFLSSHGCRSVRCSTFLFVDTIGVFCDIENALTDEGKDNTARPVIRQRMIGNGWCCGEILDDIMLPITATGKCVFLLYQVHYYYYEQGSNGTNVRKFGACCLFYIMWRGV